MSGYDWVAAPKDRPSAGLKGVDLPMANWWQLRRQRRAGFLPPELTNFSDLFDVFLFPERDDTKATKPGIGAFMPHFRAGGDEIEIPALPPHAMCKAAKLTPRSPEAIGMTAPENGVILGVIDDAIPCLHPCFRDGQTSRFLSLWQQDAPCRAGPGGTTPVPFGHMTTKPEIEALIRNGRGDDPAAYEALHLAGRAAHLPNLYRFRHSHGAAVAGFAAGADPLRCDDLMSTAPGRFPIIGVNLGLAMVEDTAGSFLPIAVLFAVQHIVNEAEALIATTGRALPLVITLSYGLSGGGRNGSDPVAAYLDAYRRYWEAAHGTPFRAVLPSGNGFQDRGVIATKLHPGAAPFQARLRATPGSRASTVVEIERLTDTPKGSDFALNVTITPPSPVTFTTPRAPGVARKNGDIFVLQKADPDSQAPAAFDLSAPKHAAVFYHHRPTDPALAPGSAASNLRRETVVLAIQPDQSKNGDEPTMPPGDWGISVALRGDPGGPAEEVELRVLRNDIPSPSRPRRQTARFVDPAIQRFDAAGFPSQALTDPGTPLRRDRTINAMATRPGCVVVGAVQGGNGPPMSPYSAAGPLEKGHPGVTLCALGDETLLRAGLPAIGLRAGATGRASGTSMAAPQVSRWLATALARAQEDGTDPFAACDTAALTKAAEPLADVPVTRQGLGRIDLPPGRFPAP